MGLHRGRGFAAINYPIGMNLGGDPSQALVHSNPDGKFTVALSSIDLGQGMKSVTRQIAAETLGIPVADVYVDTADSDTGPHCGETLFRDVQPLASLGIDQPFAGKFVVRLLDGVGIYLDFQGKRPQRRERLARSIDSGRHGVANAAGNLEIDRHMATRIDFHADS
jgi:hypothetical protein